MTEPGESADFPGDSEMERSLTIFGCGYVGTALAQYALARGCSVFALTRNESTARHLTALGVRKVVVDYLESTDWHMQMDNRQDFVVNCVSAASPDPTGYRRSYLEGQRSILGWLEGGTVGTFVYTGSTSVYTQGDGVWVDEGSRARPRSTRGKILRAAEMLIERAQGRGFDRWFILRLAGIYGPGRHYLLNQLRSGVAPVREGGAHRINLIHRDDVCSAIWSVLSAPANVRDQIVNVADGNPSTRNDIVAWLRRSIAVSEDATSKEQARRRSVVRRRSPPDRRIGTSKIRQLFGWHPRYPSYVEGYRQILDAMNLRSVERSSDR